MKHKLMAALSALLLTGGVAAYPRAVCLKASGSVMKIRRFLSSTAPSERNLPKALVTASRLAPIMVPSCWWV